MPCAITLPELEHEHVVGDPEHEPHVVVDQEHRRAGVDHPAQMVRQLLALPRVEARRRLVETEEPRLRRERARDPDQLALPLGEVFRHRVRRRLEAEELQGRVRRLRAPDRPREHLDRRRPRRRAVGGDRQVLAHAQVVEQLERLPRPRQAALGAGVGRQPVQPSPVQLDPSPVRHEPGDRVDERRLARRRSARSARRADPPRPSGRRRRAPASRRRRPRSRSRRGRWLLVAGGVRRG